MRISVSLMHPPSQADMDAPVVRQSGRDILLCNVGQSSRSMQCHCRAGMVLSCCEHFQIKNDGGHADVRLMSPVHIMDAGLLHAG